MLIITAGAGFHGAISSGSHCISRGHMFKSQLSHIAFMEIDDEIIFLVILPLLLFKEGSYQLLMKECAQVLVNRFQD